MFLVEQQCCARGGRAAPCSAAGDEGTARGLLLGIALLPLAAPAAARLTICKPNGIPNVASGYLDLGKKKKSAFLVPERNLLANKVFCEILQFLHKQLSRDAVLYRSSVVTLSSILEYLVSCISHRR